MRKELFMIRLLAAAKNFNQLIHSHKKMFKIGNITSSFEQYDKFLIFFFQGGSGEGRGKGSHSIFQYKRG